MSETQEFKASVPETEHKWLNKLLGEWTFEGECSMGPDQPPMKSSGSESVRSLGGLWTIGEGTGTAPDGQSVGSIMTLGYDPTTKRFVGTFVASMMSHMWIYNGQLNAEKTILTLDTIGPDFVNPGKMIKYQDIIEFKNDNHRTLTSRIQTENGQWLQIVVMNYKRKA